MLAIVAALLLAVVPPRYDASIIGDMDGESLGGTMTQLMSSPSDRPVQLRITSPGGNALSTLVFIELVKDLKHEREMKIVCTGSVMVASAAALLFESSVCDERILEPATVMLFHAAYLSGASGKGKDMEDDSSLLRALNRALAYVVAERLHMTVDQYLAWIDGHDRWLSADLAVELGYADRLVEAGP